MADIAEKEAYFVIDTSCNKLLDFIEIFGNKHPVVLEIGSGKGEHIATISRLYPEKNYVGVELKHKRIVTTLKKLCIERHSNVRLLNLYVDNNVSAYIPTGSVDEIVIYHPDPWPKKRHHKRRMFQHSFINAIYLLLKTGRYLKISTDSTDYAQWIRELFAERNDFELVEDTIIAPESHFTTYFDKLQSDAGFETIFLTYRRK